MKITPLWDRALLRVIRENNRTRSGLFVPEIAFAKSPMGRAEVMAVGPGRIMPDGTTRPMTIKAGDVVWFAKPRAEAVPYEGEKAGDVVIIDEEAVIAVLSDLPVDSGLVTADGAPALIVREAS
jgi:chaperonin GroES